MLNKQRRKLIIPFLAPSLILYLVFFVYPTIKSLNLSFYQWSGFRTPSHIYWTGKLQKFNQR